jgi:hypothetical protein
MRFAFRTLQDRLPKELARAPLLLGPPHLDLQKADHAPGEITCYPNRTLRVSLGTFGIETSVETSEAALRLHRS